MRITTVSSSLGAGGAERQLLFLSAWLAEQGAAVTVLTLDPDTPDFYTVPPGLERVHAGYTAYADCRWHDLPGQWRRRRALRRDILDTRPNLVISFCDTTNIRVLSALGWSRIPAIVSERIDPRHYHLGWRWNLLRRLFYPRAAQVVLVARETLPWAEAFRPRWKVRVIPNPVPAPPHKALDVPAWYQAQNIVAMGRLVRQKGFDLLLRAFAPLADEFPGWGLTILGEGPLERELRSLAGRLGIRDRVFLPGRMPEPWGALTHADVFVLSSRFEGFPNALTEAMACGLACVSFDCPSGPGTIIRHGQDGLLVPAEDIEALTETLRLLLRSPEERARLGTRAREAVERFSVDTVMGLWASCIADVIPKAMA